MIRLIEKRTGWTRGWTRRLSLPLLIILSVALIIVAVPRPKVANAQAGACSAGDLQATGSVDAFIGGLQAAGTDVAACADFLKSVYVDSLFVLAPEAYDQMIVVVEAQVDFADAADVSAVPRPKVANAQAGACSAGGLQAAGSVDAFIDDLHAVGTNIAACADFLKFVYVNNLFVLAPDAYVQMIAAAESQVDFADAADVPAGIALLALLAPVGEPEESVAENEDPAPDDPAAESEVDLADAADVSAALALLVLLAAEGEPEESVAENEDPAPDDPAAESEVDLADAANVTAGLALLALLAADGEPEESVAENEDPAPDDPAAESEVDLADAADVTAGLALLALLVSEGEPEESVVENEDPAPDDPAAESEVDLADAADVSAGLALLVLLAADGEPEESVAENEDPAPDDPAAESEVDLADAADVTTGLALLALLAAEGEPEESAAENEDPAPDDPAAESEVDLADAADVTAGLALLALLVSEGEPEESVAENEDPAPGNPNVDDRSGPPGSPQISDLPNPEDSDVVYGPPPSDGSDPNVTPSGPYPLDTTVTRPTQQTTDGELEFAERCIGDGSSGGTACRDPNQTSNPQDQETAPRLVLPPGLDPSDPNVDDSLAQLALPDPVDDVLQPVAIVYLLASLASSTPDPDESSAADEFDPNPANIAPPSNASGQAVLMLQPVPARIIGADAIALDAARSAFTRLRNTYNGTVSDANYHDANIEIPTNLLSVSNPQGVYTPVVQFYGPITNNSFSWTLVTHANASVNATLIEIWNGSAAVQKAVEFTQQFHNGQINRIPVSQLNLAPGFGDNHDTGTLSIPLPAGAWEFVVFGGPCPAAGCPTRAQSVIVVQDEAQEAINQIDALISTTATTFSRTPPMGF